MAKNKRVLLEEPKTGLEELYTVYFWGVTPRYQCSQCPMDCGSEKQMLAHIDQVHTPKEPETPASGLVIADKNYNVVEPGQGKVVATVDITEEDVKSWIEGDSHAKNNSHENNS